MLKHFALLCDFLSNSESFLYYATVYIINYIAQWIPDYLHKITHRYKTPIFYIVASLLLIFFSPVTK